MKTEEDSSNTKLIEITSCFDCPVSSYYEDAYYDWGEISGCNITGKSYPGHLKKKVASWCPLITKTAILKINDKAIIEKE